MDSKLHRQRFANFGMRLHPQTLSLLKSVQKLRALNFKIVAVSRASNRFVSFKCRWKADAEHFLRM